ncbi:VPLPA-CTERM sorting domain-containing protein [Nibricoccus aquaticus]|uniref:VPLPA-CTERM sorting domain-containing protein n=1 Tax=Nibricoccus aquaticus TaxID=2576891 RepID=A0A290QBX9_9BACT|nr:nidogen-like domain-containing protein [Nibricoccus aquaticus]ATC64700.1 VPLPA-CTERM sorting domain-containing protein [Nibricoccus aquaticus]
MTSLKLTALRASAVLLFATTALTASAQLRSFTGYNANSLARNDDESTGLVNIGFSANFFGTTYSQTYVNNNGNITFDSPLSTFTPFGIPNSGRVIIAPFFADVDTRGSDSSLVTYGTGILGGHAAFAVNYVNVGVFNVLPIYNSFQLVLVDRSDTGAGNFDFEFNYTDINWETGTASGGNDQGLGGTPVHIGYSNGTPASAFELDGSGISQFFLDSNASTGLIYNQLGVAFDGTSMDGRYAFSVRNGGVIVNPPVEGSAVPEPSTYGLIGALALGALVAFRRRAKRA